MHDDLARSTVVDAAATDGKIRKASDQLATPSASSSSRKRTIVASCSVCAKYASTVAGLAARYRAHCDAEDAADAASGGDCCDEMRMVSWQDSPCATCGTTCLATAAATGNCCTLCASVASAVYVTDGEVMAQYGGLITVNELRAGRLDHLRDTAHVLETPMRAVYAQTSHVDLLWAYVARIVSCCADPCLIKKIRCLNLQTRLVVRARRVFPCWCIISDQAGVPLRPLIECADTMQRKRVSDLGLVRFATCAMPTPMRKWQPCGYLRAKGGTLVFDRNAVLDAICSNWGVRTIEDAQRLYSSGPAKPASSATNIRTERGRE
jgi:hypothetical protein